MSEEPHELLARIDERTRHILIHLEEQKKYNERCDRRLSSLEGWRNRIVGAVSVILILMAWVGVKLSKVLGVLK